MEFLTKGGSSICLYESKQTDNLMSPIRCDEKYKLAYTDVNNTGFKTSKS